MAVALSSLWGESAAAQGTDSLVGNGGFETGLSAPWGTGQYSAGRSIWWTRGKCQATAEADSQIKRSGNRSLHVVNHSSGSANVYGTTQQPIRIEPNQTYRITLWAKAHRLASDGALNIAVDSAWQIRPIRLPKGSYDWRRFTATFALPTSTAQLRILSEDRGEVWIDDITITAHIRGGATDTLPPQPKPKADMPVPPPAKPPADVPVVAQDAVTPLPELEAEVTVVARVTPERGGVLSLPEDVRVEIPPHAVDAAVDFTAKRLKVTGPESRGMRMYDFCLGRDDIKLKAPATLHFPFDAKRLSRDKDASRVKVAVWEPNKGWCKVPTEVDANKGIAVVKTTHFSAWRFWLGDWHEYYSAARARGAEARIRLPYYAQGASGWCWCLGTQMLLKYHGNDVETWSIASTFKAEFNDDLSGFTIAADWFKDYFKGYNLQPEGTKLGWVDSTNLTGYVIYQLSRGRPVWLAPTHLKHVIVVVGFDKRGVYINDSSGAAFEYLRGSGNVNENRLVGARVTWAEWFRMVSGDGVNFPTKHTLVIRNDPPPTTPPITLTVLSGDLQIRIPHPRGTQSDYEGIRGDYAGSFTWDGTRPLGQYFSGTSVLECNYGTAPYHPGNADSISKCRVLVSNSTDKDIRGTIQLLIDDKLVVEKQTPTVPADSSNIPVNLVERKNAICLLDYRLRPGPHQLRLVLRVGGQVVDMSNIQVTIAPARPKGLWADRTESEISLTWYPNPEVKNGWGRMSYVVWENEKPVAQTTGTMWTRKLSSSEQKDYRYQVEAFVMDGRDLNSVLSEQLKVPAPNIDVMVGCLLKEGSDDRYADTGFSCPNLTLRFVDTTSKDTRSILARCTGVASMRDSDGTVMRFRTDMKSTGRTISRLKVSENDIYAYMLGTVQIDHLDKAGRLAGSAQYTKAHLILKGTMKGKKAEGTYALRLVPVALDDGVKRSGRRRFEDDDMRSWGGAWKAQMKGS